MCLNANKPLVFLSLPNFFLFPAVSVSFVRRSLVSRGYICTYYSVDMCKDIKSLMTCAMILARIAI